MMSNYTFANPEYLYLLFLIPIFWIVYVFNLRDKNTFLILSSIKRLNTKTWKSWGRHIVFFTKTLAISLLIIAFARPQSTSSWQNAITEGIDIILAMDISGSMLAQDLIPNRLEASKKVAMDFISGRPNDRIGLVIFSGESFTQCPLTTDHKVLKGLFNDVKSGMIDDGTAIGMGLATSINRLKDSKTKSKVIILLTDGVNNQGSIAPMTAAEIAQEFKMRVYTIGVGTKGYAPYPFNTPFGNIVYQDVEVKIDEKTLQDIANATNGKYFRATSNKALQEIYKEIDKLERSKIEIKEFHKKKEEFLPFAALGMIFLILSFILNNTLFKTVT
tara:strand:- start:1102 stop:2094 length:993 start_codon:yes stop_codon:yes gene_type:complete